MMHVYTPTLYMYVLACIRMLCTRALTHLRASIHVHVHVCVCTRPPS